MSIMSEGEAAEIVEEVLSDLLTRICYPPQPPSLETQLTKISYPPQPPPLETQLTNISYPPQPPPLETQLTNISYPPQPPSLETQLTKISYPPQPPPLALETEHPLLDLCTLSRELCELLKSYSLRTSTRTRVEVCQIKTLQQKASGYCGHYALYFSLALLGLCSSGDKAVAQQALAQLTHREHFWRRYWTSIGQLLSRVTADSWWPWTREHVCAGEIERSYLRYLLHTELADIAQGRVFVLQYAYGLLQDSVEHIRVVQDAVSLFVRGETNYVVFILGVTNHWVTLLAYRKCPEGIGLLYLDSNNEPVLLATETDIDKLVEAREQKYIKRKGVGYEPWKRNILRQSLCDQRDVVAVMSDCLQGTHTLSCEFVSSHWEKMLSNYREMVTTTVGDRDVHTVDLLCWLESGYSVRGLRDAYMRPLLFFGGESLTPQLRVEMQSWAEELSRMQPVGGLDHINNFLELVDELNCFLST